MIVMRYTYIHESLQLIFSEIILQIAKIFLREEPATY